jgi:hypothetical protein
MRIVAWLQSGDDIPSYVRHNVIFVTQSVFYIANLLFLQMSRKQLHHYAGGGWN